MKIGTVFKSLVEQRRMTLKEISKKIGVPNSTLSEWLNNRTPKNPEQIQKVAKALGVSMHFDYRIDVGTPNTLSGIDWASVEELRLSSKPFSWLRFAPIACH